jgi:FAD/FMN-containing dehydrogenase
MYAIESFVEAIDEVPHTTDPAIVRKKSRDYFSISPLLRSALGGLVADIVVSPHTREHVERVVRAAVAHKIPLVPRGGGTANYGQSVPSQGGVILEMTNLSGVVKVGDGVLRALGGTMMSDVDAAARKQGWELRIHPSTRSTATIAGFVAGGSGGMGSCAYGMLRDRGNVTGLLVMSVEAEPRLIELRGRDVDLVHHAYGANGIIIEVEMPLAPAWNWRECIVAFPDFMSAARFGVRLAHEAGITKKLISLQEWPTAELMADLKPYVPHGATMANCMIASQSMEAFECLVADHDGFVALNNAEGQGPYPAPLYEYAYGHGLRHVQRSNTRYTALQGMFPPDNLLPSLEAVHKEYAGQMPMRCEIFLSDGQVVAMGSHYIPFEDAQQMAQLVEFMQGAGVAIANNHASGVREVGIKVIDHRDAAFKRTMDPLNLLNPGKLDFTDEEIEKAQHVLPTSGWTFQERRAPR